MNGYIGVNNVARRIKKMYIGVNGLARKVKKGYVGIFEYPPVPTEYESVSLGTWSTTSQVDTFLSTYTPENGYSGLKLGNYVTIQDGTYNVDWVIAGFNCEMNATASDGSSYNNGPGIMMIPKTYITSYNWDSTSTSATPYINSDIHTWLNSTVYNNLYNILGNHIVNRNVLLGSAQEGTSTTAPKKWRTSAYTWTTSYLTLMSVGQCTGTFASNNNLYDDGEANYKLPVFNYEDYWVTSSSFWSRCVCGYYSGRFRAWYVFSHGSIYYDGVSTTYGVRPLMLLR